MNERTLGKRAVGPARAPRLAPAARSVLASWMIGLWIGLVRHAERPDRVIPYY